MKTQESAALYHKALADIRIGNVVKQESKLRNYKKET